MAGKYEEPDYKVLKESGKVQLRLYAPTHIAEVAMQSEKRKHRNKAFMQLFRYIDGKNIADSTIAMTVPVATQQAKGQKIAMTVPVAQQKQAEGAWRMVFYLPAAMTLEEIPTPLNEAVTIRAVPEKKMAVIRWRGGMSKKNKAKYLQQLREFIRAEGLQEVGDAPSYLFYNGPLTPWFMRRSEIMIEVK